MIQNMQITFNSEGFREILTSNGVRAVVEEATQKIANNANANLTDPKSEGYEGEVVMSPRMSNYGSGGRWVGFVRAKDHRAMADEAENKSLSRAVSG